MALRGPWVWLEDLDTPSGKCVRSQYNSGHHQATTCNHMLQLIMLCGKVPLMHWSDWLLSWWHTFVHSCMKSQLKYIHIKSCLSENEVSSVITVHTVMTLCQLYTWPCTMWCSIYKGTCLCSLNLHTRTCDISSKSRGTNIRTMIALIGQYRALKIEKCQSILW